MTAQAAPLPTPPAAPATTPAAGDPTPAGTPTPNAGGDTTPAATDTTGTEADEWADFNAERAKQTILNQRRAEADLKSKLAAERAKVEDFERAQMTEAERVKADLEKAQRERDDALKQAAEITQRQAFDTAALAAGVNPKALAAARALAGGVATTDESGSMKLDGTTFDALKAEHGYLFTTQQAAPPVVTFGAAAGQGSGGQPTSLTPEQVAFAQKAGIAPEDFAKFASRTR